MLSQKPFAATTFFAYRCNAFCTDGGYFYFKPDWIIAIVSLLVIFCRKLCADITPCKNSFTGRSSSFINSFTQTKASKGKNFITKHTAAKGHWRSEEGCGRMGRAAQGWNWSAAAKRKLPQNRNFAKPEPRIKTPIFAIQGLCGYIAERGARKPEVNKKFLASTSRNIDRLVNLVSDLDEISKLESGEQMLIQENFLWSRTCCMKCMNHLPYHAEKKILNAPSKNAAKCTDRLYADKEKYARYFITS